MNYSRKVVYEKASQKVRREQEDFKKTMEMRITRPEIAIFVDESNKDRKAARRKHGWSLVGTQVNYRDTFNQEHQVYLLGAAYCFGFVIPACDVVTHHCPE